MALNINEKILNERGELIDGAKPLEGIAGYYYVDNPETGERSIYELVGDGRYYSLRNKFNIPSE